jgi:uncharacterized protein YidB (DUF937 family)
MFFLNIDHVRRKFPVIAFDCKLRSRRAQLFTSGPVLLRTEVEMGLLDSLFGGAQGQSRGGMSPITMALLGLLAYRTFQGKGRLADMLGRKAEDPANPTAPNPGQGGLLGGLLGGGGALSGGLADLFKQFQQNGQGDKIDSWVAKGPNKAISAAELEQTLGPDKIAWLMRETGMSREQLLEGLSRELPQVVDKLTPEGRVPTQQEATQLA